MILESQSVQETHEIAKKLINNTKPGIVFALIGDLGTGKTTFSQGFAKALGINSRVGSPTFKLVSEYSGLNHKLFHIDAYRLKNSNEFLNIGGEEYLVPENSYTLIEWADIIEDVLPKSVIKLEFIRSIENRNSRKIKISGLNNEL